jgi:hypothetical protein
MQYSQPRLNVGITHLLAEHNQAFAYEMATQAMKAKPTGCQNAQFHEKAELIRQCCEVALSCHNLMAQAERQSDLEQVRMKDR